MKRPPGVEPLFGASRRRAGRSGATSPDTPKAPRPVWRRLAVPAAVVAMMAVAASFVWVPLGTHLERSSQIGDAEVRLAELVAANDADRRRIEALATDDELEQMARKDFGLAKPGEEIYRVLPSSEDPSSVPAGWPFSHRGLHPVQP